MVRKYTKVIRWGGLYSDFLNFFDKVNVSSKNFKKGYRPYSEIERDFYWEIIGSGFHPDTSSMILVLQTYTPHGMVKILVDEEYCGEVIEVSENFDIWKKLFS